MSTALADQKLRQAIEASDAFAGAPEVVGVVLFGSVARGHPASDSDIDLLILVNTSGLNFRYLRRLLPDSLRHEPISISFYTAAGLAAYIRQWSRFGAHLRREGKILHDTDGRLSKLLSVEVPISVDFELESQEHHLQTYQHVESFGGTFLSPLSHLYRIGRATVYALLAKDGVLEFDGKSAFRELLKRHPDWSNDINNVMILAPFHSRVRTGCMDFEVPFDPVGDKAESMMVQVLESISQLISHGRETS